MRPGGGGLRGLNGGPVEEHFRPRTNSLHVYPVLRPSLDEGSAPMDLSPQPASVPATPSAKHNNPQTLVSLYMLTLSLPPTLNTHAPPCPPSVSVIA